MLTIALIAAMSADPYGTARQQAQETGKPLLVLIGAGWCQPCQRLKSQIKADSDIKAIVGYLDIDAEPGRARPMMRGTSIPQLTAWRFDGDKWRRSETLVGVQSPEAVRRLVASVAP